VLDKGSTIYLEGNNIGDFQPYELNEVLLLVYNVLTWAVRDQADMLTLRPTGFTWSKRGFVVGDFPTHGTSPNPTYFEALQRIVQRDQVVQMNVKNITSSPQELTYSIESSEG
jgi:hypothetical protein